jgi:hypothetical protein
MTLSELRYLPHGEWATSVSPVPQTIVEKPGGGGGMRVVCKAEYAKLQ